MEAAVLVTVLTLSALTGIGGAFGALTLVMRAIETTPRSTADRT